jgi:spore germination protein PC
VHNFQTYLQMMEQRIRNLEDRALLAEKELRDLKESFQHIKPVNIDSINYKVQELVVSDLSGTLHVGLTALTDSAQLEKWMQQHESGEEVKLENLQSEEKGAL